MRYIKLLFVIFLFLFFKNVANAQSGIVTYTVKSIDFEVDIKKAKFNNFANELREKAKSQEFLLEFNSLISKFSLDANLKSDESEKNIIVNKMAAVRFTSNYIHYNQKKSNNSVYVLEDGNIIKSPDQKWVISTESKKIDNYLCYKATCEKTYLARDQNLKTLKVEAWFAPSLPYSYGPKGYAGLPGLILELQDKETTYLASRIKLLAKETKINWPKGKILNEEDYLKKTNSKQN